MSTSRSFQFPFDSARMRRGTETGFFCLNFHLPSVSTDTMPSLAPVEASETSTILPNLPSPSTFSSSFSALHSAFFMRNVFVAPSIMDPPPAGAFLTLANTISPDDSILTRPGVGTGLFCLNRQLPSDPTETAPSITPASAADTFTIAPILPCPSTLSSELSVRHSALVMRNVVVPEFELSFLS